MTKLIPMYIKDPSKMPEKVLSQEKEFDSLNEVKEKIANEFDCDVEIEKADESEEKKAANAMPSKPGVVVKK